MRYKHLLERLNEHLCKYQLLVFTFLPQWLLIAPQVLKGCRFSFTEDLVSLQGGERQVSYLQLIDLFKRLQMFVHCTL